MAKAKYTQAKMSSKERPTARAPPGHAAFLPGGWRLLGAVGSVGSVGTVGSVGSVGGGSGGGGTGSIPPIFLKESTKREVLR